MPTSDTTSSPSIVARKHAASVRESSNDVVSIHSLDADNSKIELNVWSTASDLHLVYWALILSCTYFWVLVANWFF